MMHQPYALQDIVRIERWLEEHGIEVQYVTDDNNMPEGAFAFNEKGEWVDHDPLNPCRVPLFYEMLGIDETVQAGDIYWHPAWTRWFVLTSNHPMTMRKFGMPVARKIP